MIRGQAPIKTMWRGASVIKVVSRILVAALLLLVTAPASPRPPSMMRSVDGNGRNFDYSYRVVGSVRLLFFWVSSDDIGGARVARRERHENLTLSLLIGSDPRRAPRQVNEWGYIRESSSGRSATVFGIRTLTDGSSPEDAERRRNQAARGEKTVEMGVLCSTVSPVELRSRTTTASVSRDVTYRELGRVLSVIEQGEGERGVQWRRRGALRPANGYPGFLIALDHLMRSNALAADAIDKSTTVPRLVYVYKDAVYDLVARSAIRVPQLTTHVGVLRNKVSAAP